VLLNKALTMPRSTQTPNTEVDLTSLTVEQLIIARDALVSSLRLPWSEQSLAQVCGHIQRFVDEIARR
jgi:hypothetical protein